MVEDWEGCLSIPDIRGRVPRARQIACAPTTGSGKKIEIPPSGFTARVIQHETDHLDGVLFFDRMKTFQSLTFLDEFGRYWSGTEGGLNRFGDPGFGKRPGALTSACRREVRALAPSGTPGTLHPLGRFPLPLERPLGVSRSSSTAE